MTKSFIQPNDITLLKKISLYKKFFNQLMNLFLTVQIFTLIFLDLSSTDKPKSLKLLLSKQIYLYII